MEIWINKLISENEADSVETAKAWIRRFKDNNKEYFTEDLVLTGNKSEMILPLMVMLYGYYMNLRKRI